LTQDRRKREGAWSDPGLVLLSSEGKPIDGDNLGRAWRRFRALLVDHGVRPLTMHSTRHTFAMLALEAGRPLAWVAEVLGHSNSETTLRHCSHAIPDENPDLAFLDDTTAPDSSGRHQIPIKQKRRTA
jgi:integrase